MKIYYFGQTIEISQEKININSARTFETGGLATFSGDYYTEEHQISVAKYSPFAPINLYNRVNLAAKSGATADYFEIEGNREVELKEAGYIGATVVCTETVPLHRVLLTYK